MKMKRTGPDSVNSWLIAAGCTFVSMIIYAVVRLSGVLFVASMSRYDVGRQRASMPYILVDFIQAISSPLTGYLAHKFGARHVMAFGCFVSAVGIGACFLAQDIETVNIFWGVIFGVGFGLSCPLLAVMVTQHFVNKRAIAIGVVYFGGYTGYSILPTIAEYLIDYYGLSGTFLFISAMMLHCVPMSMLLKKPKFTIKSSTTQESTTSKEVNNHELYPSTTVTQKEKSVDLHQNITHKDILTHKEHSNGRTNEGFVLENNPEVDEMNYAAIPTVLDLNDLSEPHKRNVEKPSNEHQNHQPFCTSDLNAPELMNEYVKNQKVKNVEASESSSVGVICGEAVENDEKMSNKTNGNSNLMKDKSKLMIVASASSKPSFRAFKVFFEPVFILVLVAGAVFEGSFIAFVTIIIDFTMDVGLPMEDGKFVMLAFALSSVVGLLGFGWVTDNGHLTLTNFCGLLFVGRCITSILIPFSKGLPFLVVAVMVHGVCEAPLSNLLPLIIADYYAQEVHEVAISCRLFLCAPVYLVTPTLIGYFRDDLGSYFYLFCLIGFCSLVCGVLMILAPRLAKFRCGRDETILRNVQ